MSKKRNENVQQTSPGGKRWFDFLTDAAPTPLFGIETRSLALFRIAIALLLLVDLGTRATDLTTFYTDAGVLPSALARSFYAGTKVFWYNPHIYVNTAWWQAGWFVVAAFFAVLLLIGYRTRWVAFAGWFLLLSLHNRNPMVLQSGDTLLRMLLFWGMFLPMGAKYSVDRALDPTDRPSPRVVNNVISLALLVQMTFLYYFTAELKSGATWRNGNALYYALNIDAWTRPLGTWMLNFPEWNAFATHATMVLEYVGPFLPFIPLFTAQFRTLMVFVFCSFHIGIALMMDVGLFSYISMAGWLVYLPSPFWTFLEQRLGRWGEGLAMYYDGDCGFCKKGVLLGQTFLILPRAQVAPAHTRRDVNDLMQEKNSWVVVADDQMLVEFDAVIAVLSASILTVWLTPLLRLGPIHGLGTRAYRTVANNRRFFSKFTRPLTYRKQTWKTYAVFQVFALVCLVYVWAWNVRSVNFNENKSWFPRSYNSFGYFFRLDQYWAMFAPDPTRVDGWFVIPATLENGQEIDLYKNGAEVSYDKPEVVCYQHANMRWRKYMMNLKILKNADHRDPFAKHLCDRWNTAHPDQTIRMLRVIFMREDTPNPKETQQQYPRKVYLKNHTCDN